VNILEVRVMREFEPSRDFVSKVMKRIRDYEEGRASNMPLSNRLVGFKSIRYAVSVGGLLLALVNLMRLYSAVFSTVVAR
jgi:hypothetical protein